MLVNTSLALVQNHHIIVLVALQVNFQQGVRPLKSMCLGRPRLGNKLQFWHAAVFLSWDLFMSNQESEQVDQSLLFEVIENQLADAYPAKVKETLMRLRMTGHSQEEAMELIACALAPEMLAVVEQQQQFNLTRYEQHLDLLPETPWLAAE